MTTLSGDERTLLRMKELLAVSIPKTTEEAKRWVSSLRSECILPSDLAKLSKLPISSWYRDGKSSKFLTWVQSIPHQEVTITSLLIRVGLQGYPHTSSVRESSHG